MAYQVLSTLRKNKMTVTQIEYITKTKAKVYIDEVYRFLLTNREINQYDIFIGKNIDDMVLDEILNECILKKAKKKAMDLLTVRDRTENELRRSLKTSHFTEDIIKLAIAYVNQYNYLDNKRYVENYLAYRNEEKSLKMLKYELKEKGIPETLFMEVLEAYDHNDIRNIKKILLKRYGDAPVVSTPEKQKLINYLLRRGYHYTDIMDCIKDFNINNNTAT